MALRLAKGFVICDVICINITKEVLFLLPNQTYTELRCLLYAFLSMSLFVFKNLFLRRDFFMISLFIFLFMKIHLSRYFATPFHSAGGNFIENSLFRNKHYTELTCNSEGDLNCAKDNAYL